MITKTKRLVECNGTHAALSEAKSLGTGKNGRPKYEVVLITEGKGNPRDRHYYSQACINDPITREAFEGKPCFLNHPSTMDDQIQPERRVQDRAGWFTNVHADGVALKATLNISKTKTGDFLEAFIQDCLDYSLENAGQDYAGLSINANGESSPVELDGEEWNQVDRITEAESVDAVTKAARGGRFEKKLEAFRKKRETDADKVSKACEIVQELRDKIQAAGEFPLQKDLRRMSDNLLTLLGTSQEGEPMKTTESEKKKLEASQAARSAAHAALTGLAAQAGDDATKKILMDHAAHYAPKDEPDGDEPEATGKESEDEDEKMTKDEKEAEAKKQAEAEKEKEGKKEAEKKDEKESENEDEKESEAKKEASVEALRKEIFDLKLEKMLKESELPEPFQKSVRIQAQGKTLKQVESIIESEAEKVNYFSLRESGVPALNRGTGKENSSGPILSGFLDEK